VALDDLAGLTPALARAYGRRSQRTVRRDVEWGPEQRLVVKDETGRYTANPDLILAFLPGRAGAPQPG
jgi:hypothetical protein